MAPAHHRHEHVHDDVHDRVEDVLRRLRDEGGRVTSGRRAIVHQLLAGPDHHVTAEAVARSVQEEQPDVHLSTVYRTLDALGRLGVVDRISLGDGSAVYHLTDHVHHHLVCDMCGDVIEVPSDVAAGLARDVDERYGFELHASHLVLPGLCSNCRGTD